jgi:predicted DsbA family dithiol-disulfide isomerase
MTGAADGDHVIEVFADITCPFTHVGLKRVIEHVDALTEPRRVHVRAWPLEWVNGTGLDVAAVLVKAATLAEQLGVDDFAGFDGSHWPASTIPALELAASAYGRDMATGLAVSVEVRAAVFERGLDVSDPVVLGDIADRHRVPWPNAGAAVSVRADYDEGRRRGVAGSPHFWVGDDDYFCPALDLGHDAAGKLTASFDPAGLAEFFARIDA